MGNSKAKPIPTTVRAIVKEREQGRCFRCGMRGYEMSHRRTRSVRDGKEHRPSNLLLFCRTCHVWLHTNPTEAMASGWAVSRYEDEPETIPALRWDGSFVLLDDAGRATLVGA